MADDAVDGRHVVVVGAGVMGRGIAYVAAVGGATVTLVDVEPEQLTAAVATIARDLDAGVARGRVDAATALRAREAIASTSDLEIACASADLVIEAVVERMDVKQEVFRRTEQSAPGHAVIATNTSALSVTQISSVLADPSRGVGMHFFNPVPKMRLCELVWGDATSVATMDAADAAARAMGKTTVRVRDVAGFATSRLNALLGNEGLRMLEERVANAEDIDTAARLGLNHPMGPLEMADLVGLDVRLAVLEYLAGELGDRFAPTDVHRRLVAEGRLGRKTGRGVYAYDDDGQRTDAPSDLP